MSVHVSARRRTNSLMDVDQRRHKVLQNTPFQEKNFCMRTLLRPTISEIHGMQTEAGSLHEGLWISFRPSFRLILSLWILNVVGFVISSRRRTDNNVSTDVADGHTTNLVTEFFASSRSTTELYVIRSSQQQYPARWCDRHLSFIVH